MLCTIDSALFMDFFNTSLTGSGIKSITSFWQLNYGIKPKSKGFREYQIYSTTTTKMDGSVLRLPVARSTPIEESFCE